MAAADREPRTDKPVASMPQRQGADSEEKQEPAIDINIEPWTV
jgi:hypothetical protein